MVNASQKIVPATLPPPRRARTHMCPPVKTELSPICWRYKGGPDRRAVCWEGLISLAATLLRSRLFALPYHVFLRNKGHRIWVFLTLWRLWAISQRPNFWMWKRVSFIADAWRALPEAIMGGEYLLWFYFIKQQLLEQPLKKAGKTWCIWFRSKTWSLRRFRKVRYA